MNTGFDKILKMTARFDYNGIFISDINSIRYPRTRTEKRKDLLPNRTRTKQTEKSRTNPDQNQVHFSKPTWTGTKHAFNHCAENGPGSEK